MNQLQPLEELLERHVAFWRRKPVDRPLIADLPPRQWIGKPYPISGGAELVDPTQITPADIDIDRLLGLDKPLPELLSGDLIRSIGCVYPQAWMEGLIGCRIVASCFGCVSKPVTDDIFKAVREFSVESCLHSKWLPVMEAILNRADEAACGRWAVQPLHLRGIVDMLAAYLGEELLCLALHDCPEQVELLADRFADCYIVIARKMAECRRAWHGGYVSTWQLYAPGILLDYQIDASNLISPAKYKRHLLASDVKVLKEFPFSLVHLHACGLHQLDALLDVAEIDTIQINIDRETGNWDREHILSCCRRVQGDGKSLLLCGELDDQEFEQFKSALDPQGLALMRYAYLA